MTRTKVVKVNNNNINNNCKTVMSLKGQQLLKNKLVYLIKYADKTGLPFPHMLLTGPAGLGKSTFCRAIAADLNRPYVEAYGPSIQQEKDLISLFYTDKLREPNTIIFIDEIHSMNPKVTEWLYGLMQECSVTTTNGVIKFPPFTLLAGTTDPGKIKAPLRSRFIMRESLYFYNDADIYDIITDEFNKRNPDWKTFVDQEVDSTGPLLFHEDSSTSTCICNLCVGTPRLAVNLAKAVMIYAIAFDLNPFLAYTWEGYFKANGIMLSGLTQTEVEYLRCIELSVDGVVGISTLCSSLRLTANDVIEVIEPKLLALGLINISSAGRSLTEKGKVLLL